MQELPIRDITAHDDNCVRRVPIFAGLTAPQQDLVATMARPQLLDDGELIHRVGERTGKMFVVHSGQVKLHRVLPTGRKLLIRVAQPGETLGEHAFLTSSPTLDEAEAMDGTRLCVFIHDDLAGLIQRYPDIAHRMLRTLGHRLAQTEHQLVLNTQSVEVRLADYLLQQPVLRNSPSGGFTTVRLPLDKQDVASLLGTTPESFSRALARLRTKGFIGVDDDTITLRDLDALEDLVAGAA